MINIAATKILHTADPQPSNTVSNTGSLAGNSGDSGNLLLGFLNHLHQALQSSGQSSGQSSETLNTLISNQENNNASGSTNLASTSENIANNQGDGQDKLSTVVNQLISTLQDALQTATPQTQPALQDALAHLEKIQTLLSSKTNESADTPSTSSTVSQNSNQSSDLTTQSNLANNVSTSQPSDTGQTISMSPTIFQNNDENSNFLVENNLANNVPTTQPTETEQTASPSSKGARKGNSQESDSTTTQSPVTQTTSLPDTLFTQVQTFHQVPSQTDEQNTDSLHSPLNPPSDQNSISSQSTNATPANATQGAGPTQNSQNLNSNLQTNIQTLPNLISDLFTDIFSQMPQQTQALTAGQQSNTPSSQSLDKTSISQGGTTLQQQLLTTIQSLQGDVSSDTQAALNTIAAKLQSLPDQPQDKTLPKSIHQLQLETAFGHQTSTDSTSTSSSTSSTGSTSTNGSVSTTNLTLTTDTAVGSNTPPATGNPSTDLSNNGVTQNDATLTLMGNVQSGPAPITELFSNSVFNAPPSTGDSGVPAPHEQVIQAAQLSIQGGQKEMSIMLTPDNLGDVRLTLISNSQNEVSARLITQTAEAKDALQQNISELTRSLEDSGIKIGNISVIHAGSSSFDGNSSSFHFSQQDQSNGSQQFSQSNHPFQQQAQSSTGNGSNHSNAFRDEGSSANPGEASSMVSSDTDVGGEEVLQTQNSSNGGAIDLRA
jgi:Flagellar hook-length control protein FliK